MAYDCVLQQLMLKLNKKKETELNEHWIHNKNDIDTKVQQKKIHSRTDPWTTFLSLFYF